MILKSLKSFAKLEVAIFLLLLIAGFSILGTIIEQERNINYYLENYNQEINFLKITIGDLLLFCGLNNIYKSWWFLTLLLLFGTCLISCTILQQLPMLRQARRCSFKIKEKQYKNPQYSVQLKEKNFSNTINRFKLKRYTVFQQNKGVYLYKGILGRFAPIVVHFAMILTLSGAAIAALTSFKAEELIAKGEIFQVQNTVSQSLFSSSNPTPVRVNDFWIEYGEKENIKQFYSNLSILDKDGSEIKEETISVNHPLRYKGATIYQTDWNAIGVRIKDGEKQYQVPLSPLTNRKDVWVSWIPVNNSESNGVILILKNTAGNFEIYKQTGELIGKFNIGEEIKGYNNLYIKEILCETGLQIKADPGIPLIYFGFGLLMLSSLISYLAFNQFWILKNKKDIFIRGTSNRAKLNLKLELAKLNQ